MILWTASLLLRHYSNVLHYWTVLIPQNALMSLIVQLVQVEEIPDRWLIHALIVISQFNLRSVVELNMWYMLNMTSCTC